MRHRQRRCPQHQLFPRRLRQWLAQPHLSARHPECGRGPADGLRRRNVLVQVRVQPRVQRLPLPHLRKPHRLLRPQNLSGGRLPRPRCSILLEPPEMEVWGNRLRNFSSSSIPIYSLGCRNFSLLLFIPINDTYSNFEMTIPWHSITFGLMRRQ